MGGEGVTNRALTRVYADLVCVVDIDPKSLNKTVLNALLANYLIKCLSNVCPVSFTQDVCLFIYLFIEC